MYARHSYISVVAVSCLLVLLLVPSVARANLSGEAELGYVSYDSEQKDASGTVDSRLNGTSFRQRYSLLYDTQGEIADGRFATYDLTMGYEWGSFDTRVKRLNDDTSLSVSAGHVLFRGEVVVDPAELPIRIRAYSRDLNRTTFIDTYLNNDLDYMISPDLTTDLRDGTRISSGATVLLGVKNGLTNGYNALFRNLPMLMVDYRDELVHDVNSITPIDTRLRRLAFISLNKRDNWVHYRSTKYEDFINPDQSYNENQVQIGTVDQKLMRRWIDLTNWIKVSADAQFTKHNAASPVDNFEEYDVNFFGIASRSSWEARTFANYNRLQQNGSYSVSRTIPLYMAGTWGFDTDWNARVINLDKIDYQGTPNERKSSSNAASVRFLTLKRANFTVSPRLSVEYATDDEVGKNIAVEAGVETRSTRRFSREYDLFSSYTARFIKSNDVAASDSGSYVAQDLNVSVGYAPTPQTRLSGSETISLTSGNTPASSGNTTISGGSVSTLNDTGILGEYGATSNGYMRSLSMLSFSWLPGSRIRTSLTAQEDIISVSNQPLYSRSAITNSVSYTAPTYQVSLDSSVYLHSGIDGSSYAFDFNGAASYRPNRNVDAYLRARVNLSHDTTNDVRYVDLQQRFNYYILKYNGIVRHLVELSEELNYQDVTTTSTSSQSVYGKKWLTLGAKYFPFARVFVGGFARYAIVDPGALTQQLYSASLGVTYRKLQADVEYSFGNQYGDQKRYERKFAANLRKYF